MKKLVLITLALLLLTSSLLLGCSANDANGKITIVATTFPLYDWAKEVTKGADVNLVLLISNGTDVHSYQPSVSDIAKIANCDLFLYVGGESDSWVKSALVNKTNKNRQEIAFLSSGAITGLDEEIVEGMEEEEGEEEEEALDEHIWLSLRNAEKCASLISETLSKIDDKNKDIYNKNATDYVKELDELDKSFEEAVGKIDNKTIIFADRFPYRYFANDYGFTYYAPFAGCSAETEASFKTVAFLNNKIKELDAKVVFILKSSDGKLANTIVDGTGAEIVSVNSLERITQKDADNGVRYIDIMSETFESFKKALVK